MITTSWTLGVISIDPSYRLLVSSVFCFCRTLVFSSNPCSRCWCETFHTAPLSSILKFTLRTTFFCLFSISGWMELTFSYPYLHISSRSLLTYSPPRRHSARIPHARFRVSWSSLASAHTRSECYQIYFCRCIRKAS